MCVRRVQGYEQTDFGSSLSRHGDWYRNEWGIDNGIPCMDNNLVSKTWMMRGGVWVDGHLKQLIHVVKGLCPPHREYNVE